MTWAFGRLFARRRANRSDALARQLDELAGRNGGAAVNDCARLLAETSIGTDALETLRGFCRGLLDQRRHSYLVSLEESLREQPGASPDAAAMIAFYALRAQEARQCYETAAALYANVLISHRRRGAYTAWEEHLIDEVLANALMKQARTAEALAVVEAARRTEPNQPALRVLRARLIAAKDPAAALEELRRTLDDARKGEESLPAAALLGANIASALGKPESGQNMLRAHGEDGRFPDLHLAHANLAHARQDYHEQRRRIDAWFAHFGLWSPAATGEGPFRIESIAPSGLAQHQEGPLISVIMTTYNAADTVRYAVQSILTQTHANLELFIVDDASTDATCDTLQALAATDSRLRLLFNETNAGPYVAKNRAIQAATGEFITFHDADDWRHPQHLARHLAAMMEKPSLVASRSRWSRINAEGAFTLAPWGAYAHACPSATMIRRAIIDEVGYFDSVRIGADTEFWARIETSYGFSRLAEMAEPLALGLARADSLTVAGPGAIGADGASAPRLAYWEAQARWRDARWLSEDPLFIPFPLAERPFPAPANLMP